MSGSIISILDIAYDLVLRVTLFGIRWTKAQFEPAPGLAYLPHDVREGEPFVPKAEVPTAVATPTPRDVSVVLSESRGKSTVMYTAVHEAPLYREPTVAFDSQIARIPYGALVLAVELQGRFCKVIWNTCEGWVRKEHLADRARAVYPEFIQGAENPAESLNAVRVRACIGDVFGLAHSEFPLQAGEYVLYRLFRRGFSIPWPQADAPRVPGSWHSILRGVAGVHIRVTPKVGTILEYTGEHDIGHLAYVEAVFPDETIVISEANYPHSGIYSERTLNAQAWRALKPLYIEVSHKI